jgi:hypothetical protein
MFISQAVAETSTYQIPAQQQRLISFNLNNGDSASGTIILNGAGSVDFWISDPQNRNVTAYTNIGQTEFSINAEISGTFFFHIFNKSIDSVSATLNYNVVHRIFGMPQEIFLLLVIVGVLLLLIIFWAILSKI